MFARLFAAKENRLNLYEAMNSGRVVLVNTSRSYLGEASSTFGRYMIAVTLKAAFDRSRIPEGKRHPAYVYIDEASQFFDDNVEKFLTQARKFKVGCVMALQNVSQIPLGLRDVVLSNTTTKLTGGVSGKDARTLSIEMRTTPEIILSQKKIDGRSTSFALFVKNKMQTAKSLEVPFLTMERMPRRALTLHAWRGGG